MKLRALPICGAFVVELESAHDARGSFSRTFDARVMRSQGLVDVFAVEAVAHNIRAGTVRGLHLQYPPYGQTKLVRALRGRLFDALVDVRADSPTFGRALDLTLSELDGNAIYIPAGCAHGYQTLCDGTVAAYSLAGDYEPAAAGGIRYDDPTCAIAWPLTVTAISLADLNLPVFSDAAARHRVAASSVAHCSSNSYK